MISEIVVPNISITDYLFSYLFISLKISMNYLLPQTPPLGRDCKGKNLFRITKYLGKIF